MSQDQTQTTPEISKAAQTMLGKVQSIVDGSRLSTDEEIEALGQALGRVQIAALAAGSDRGETQDRLWRAVAAGRQEAFRSIYQFTGRAQE